MINLDEIKKIRSLSVVIVPDSTGTTAKSKKISVNGILIILLAYTFVAAIAGFFIIGATPLGNIYLAKNTNLSAQDIKQINELNEKLIYVTRELEAIKNANRQTKRAMQLGDSSIFKKDDTAKNLRKKGGGSILTVIEDLFNSLYQEKFSFFRPVNGYVSRGFNPDKGHMGMDFVVKTGTPVYAAASGYIVFSGYNAKDGNMIIINHAEGYTSVYKHCSSLLKREREKVLEGELIALSGNTGEITTGPHLHFEIWENGLPVDPAKVLLNTQGD